MNIAFLPHEYTKKKKKKQNLMSKIQLLVNNQDTTIPASQEKRWGEVGVWRERGSKNKREKLIYQAGPLSWSGLDEGSRNNGQLEKNKKY